MSFDTGNEAHDHGAGGSDDDGIGSVTLAGSTRDPGLGLLLELVKRGEQDPWDIDIVALTDQYLRALDDQLDPRDLGKVARLIFYAAALVHLKAQALAEKEQRFRHQESLANLDAQLDELADALRGRHGLLPGDQPLLRPGEVGVAGLMPRDRRPRERGLTLLDLISALRSYDERLAQAELALAQQPSYDEELLAPECLGSSHQDDLDRDIVCVREDLWRLLAAEGAQVTLDGLVAERAGRTRAGAYLALLFLAQDEEVVLQQQEQYGELRVGRGQYFGEIRAGVRTEDDEVETEAEVEVDAKTEVDDEVEAEAEADTGTKTETETETEAETPTMTQDAAAPDAAEAKPRARRKRRSRAAVAVEARDEEVSA